MARDSWGKYESDVYYEVWLSGRNPDAIDYDRLEDSYYMGFDPDEAALREIRAQDKARMAREEEEYYSRLEEQYYADLECEYYENLQEE